MVTNYIIYICSLNFNIEALKIQQEEVAKIKILALNKLISKVNSNNNNFVPHGNDYFRFVLNEIKKY